MSGHPGLEKEYALDFLTPVRYVATALEGASALSGAELAAGYEHYNPGDLARVRSYEGLASNSEANAFLVERALLALKDQVAENGDGKWHLTRPFDELRYGRKKLHLIVDEHAVLRDPFNPMSGRWADNIRRKGRDSMDELRESMREFGWVSEFPALIDERGVVLVGHRRLTVAAELGIDPVKKTLRLGSGDEADAERLRIALVSNIGFKDMTPEERKDISEYLYGEREWSQQRIAKALDVAQSTVSLDLAELSTVDNSKRRGRPRKTIKKPAIAKSPEKREEYRALATKGKSNDEIKETMGIGEGTRHALATAVEIEDTVSAVEDDFETAVQAFIAKWGEERVRKHFCS